MMSKLKSNTLGFQTPFDFSNLAPLDLVYGLVWDPLAPGGGPKCFFASLSLGPLRSNVLVPMI
jgi:hypothetical protein